MERFVQGEDEAPEHIPALPEKGEAMEKGPGEQFSMTEPGADGSFHLKWPSEKAKGFLVPGKESGAGQLPEGQFPAGQSRPYQVRVCMRFNIKDTRAQSACNLSDQRTFARAGVSEDEKGIGLRLQKEHNQVTGEVAEDKVFVYARGVRR